MKWQSSGWPDDNIMVAWVSPQIDLDCHEVGRIGGHMVTLDVGMLGFRCVAKLKYRVGHKPIAPPSYVLQATEAWIDTYHKSMQWQEYLDKLFNKGTNGA